MVLQTLGLHKEWIGILFTSSQLDTYSEKTKRESFITWRHVYAT